VINLSISGFIVFFVIAIIYIIISDYQESIEWRKFKVDHKCKIVAHIDSSSSPTFGISGSGKPVFGSTYISGKDGWLCNDGITYYKDN